VRIVTRTKRSEHITPILAELHWLPVKYRIQLKIVFITCKVVTSKELNYLDDIIRPSVPSRRLRSSDRNLLHKNRTNFVMANRAFSQSVPPFWNSLLQMLFLIS